MNQFNRDIETTIQKYVRNKLPDNEMEEFEDYFVDKPVVLEKIEIAREMLLGLRSSGEQVLLDAVEQPKRGGFSSLVRRLAGWVSTPTPAYASAIACLGFVFVFSIVQSSMSRQLTFSQPTLIGFSTEQTRDANRSVAVDLSSKDQNRTVFIKLPNVEYRQYMLNVIDSDSNELVWQSASFSFSALRDRMVLLPEHIRLANVRIELLAERPNQAPLSVRFCHYSEACD